MATKEEVIAFKEACKISAKVGIDYIFFSFLPKGVRETKISAFKDFVTEAAPLCDGTRFQSAQTTETIINCLPDGAEKTALRETAKFFGLHP